MDFDRGFGVGQNPSDGRARKATCSKGAFYDRAFLGTGNHKQDGAGR
jgi:hypothetical protein